MQREIKFRAWDKREEEIVYDINLLSSSKHRSGWICDVGSGGFFNPKSEYYEIMQYTGLKGKNGREIYEGDILKYPNGEIVNVIWMVNPASFSPKEIDILHAPHIIGNIYENPELIGEK